MHIHAQRGRILVWLIRSRKGPFALLIPEVKMTYHDETFAAEHGDNHRGMEHNIWPTLSKEAKKIDLTLPWTPIKLEVGNSTSIKGFPS